MLLHSVMLHTLLTLLHLAEASAKLCRVQHAGYLLEQLNLQFYSDPESCYSWPCCSVPLTLA